MKFTFDLFHGQESPSKDFIAWVPKWWYRSVGLPMEKGVLPSGEEWLLVGWFLSEENPTEIISRFRSTGIETLFRTDGQFILAVYCRSNDCLEIYRDRTGILPVVYAEGKNSIGISSWIENVIEFTRMKATVSQELLQEYPVYRLTFVPDTPVHGIKTLSGRYSLRITATRIETIEHPMTISGESLYRNLGEASRDLGESLSLAVKQRLKHCRNLGAWLSGGNDSSLLVALARKHYGGSIKTIFVTFEDYPRNYSDYANHVSKQFQTEHLEVIVSPREYLNLWAMAIHSIEAPLNHPGTIGQLAAFKELPGAVDSMLAGEGADSVFGGPYWAVMILLSYTANILPSGVRGWLKQISRTIEETSFLSKSIVKSLKALSTPLREYMLHGHTIGDEDTIDKVFGKGAWKRTIADRQGLIGNDPLNDLIFFLMLDWFPATIGANIRLGFQHNLTFLFPFFDYQLMQNSLRLPARLRYHYTTKKAALKVYARNYFDRRFIYKPKEGFGVPLGKWFTKPEFKPFLNLPLEERSLKRGWWNKEELRRVIERHQAGEGNDKTAESVPWIATNLELWARICLEGESPETYKIS